MLVCTFPTGPCALGMPSPHLLGVTQAAASPCNPSLCPRWPALGSWWGRAPDAGRLGVVAWRTSQYQGTNRAQNKQVSGSCHSVCQHHPGISVSSPPPSPVALPLPLAQPGSPALTLGSHPSGPCSIPPSHSTAETRLSSCSPWDGTAGGHPLGSPCQILHPVPPAAGHSPL